MSDETKLLVKLKNSNPSTRYEACEELRISGEISPEAIASLQAAMNDTDADVADAAKRAYDTHTTSGPMVKSQYPPMLQAVTVLADPTRLDKYPSPYLILVDKAISSLQFDNLNRALCLAAERGWRPLSISCLNSPVMIQSQSAMYVLLERSGSRLDAAQPQSPD